MENSTYKCPHCTATFSSQSALDAHINKEHLLLDRKKVSFKKYIKGK